MRRENKVIVGGLIYFGDIGNGGVEGVMSCVRRVEKGKRIEEKRRYDVIYFFSFVLLFL